MGLMEALARLRASPAPTREARDTSFLLLLIAWTLAPHLPQRPFWVGVLTVAVLIWRGHQAWRQSPLPGRGVRLGVLAVAVGLSYLGERTLLGRDAGLTLLVVLMVLKTLELRARRDAMVVFFLGFFLLLAQFLHSQSLVIACHSLVAAWGWLTALTLAHMPAGRPPIREAARHAARIGALGLPVMLLLFLLFPRIGPLWSVPDGGARTGLGDHLQLGDVAELALDDTIALRVQFEGERPAADQLYFRGLVLGRYDGQSWQANATSSPTGSAPPTVERPEPTLAYALTVEPTRLTVLPLLEHTLELTGSLPAKPTWAQQADEDGQWRLTSPLAERLHLKATAWPKARRDLVLDDAQQRALLDVPAGHHPRTRAWAQTMRAGMSGPVDAEALAKAVMRHIRVAGFVYSLSPGSSGAETDLVDAFWLDRRVGFCEHYAVSFVVILRSLGVPARIVTGYQGADTQPQDGQWIVRQSHAHAWAEYWQAGRGWVRADPTAAVAPERVIQGRRLQGPSGMVLGAIDAVSPDLRQALRRWYETLEHRWNQSVVGYGQVRQWELLSDWGLDSPDPLQLWRVLMSGVAIAALGAALWAAFQRHRQLPWARVMIRVRASLAHLGLDAAPHEDPGRLATRVLALERPASEALAACLHELQRMRYGPTATSHTPTVAWWRQFRAAVRACQRQARPMSPDA